MRVDHDGSEGSHNAAAASSPRHASPILPCTSYEQCLVGSASWTYSKARFRSAIFSRYGTPTLHGNLQHGGWGSWLRIISPRGSCCTYRSHLVRPGHHFFCGRSSIARTRQSTHSCCDWCWALSELRATSWPVLWSPGAPSRMLRKAKPLRVIEPAIKTDC